MSTLRQIVERVLAGRDFQQQQELARVYAPANIALVKYWGKRDETLHLPVTGSLSVSLGPLGSHIELARAKTNTDEVWLNGERLEAECSFVQRASEFLDLFRPEKHFSFDLKARNTVPTAAGFASSASGFAALTKAVNELFGWGLGTQELSVLARLGSGSAARSLEDGFVEWHRGTADDGMDSFAERLDVEWPEFHVGAWVLCAGEKPIGSRDGMRRCVQTCEFYREWPERVAKDLAELKAAIAQKDFAKLGAVAEANALAMHALMAATRPPIVYALPETLAAMRAVWAARAAGIAVWFTMDAGPNVKLLFEKKEEPRIRKFIAASCEAAALEVVAPFGTG